MIDLAKLKAPFAPDRVSWRIGSTTADKSRGMALAYLDARDVMERLDEVCGAAGWQCRYPHANGKTVCEIGIFVTHEQRTPHAGPGGSALVDKHGEWVWKADGAGDTDVEAEKGALSDAFKRAAVRWGIGRYLYDMPSPWVAIEQKGKSYIIKESEYAQLASMLGKSAPAPAEGLQEDAGEAADGLISLLKKCSSPTELADLKASAGFSGVLNSLPEMHYKLVAAVYSKMKAELAPKAA